MKKFFQILLSSTIVVLIWILSLRWVVSTWVGTHSVQPSFPYYSSLLTYADPSSAVWAHFDGAHYLKLATVGYVDQGTQAFFPVYPLTIRLFTSLGFSPFVAGVFISLASLILSLTLLRYLFPHLSLFAASTILILPTSFFFGSVYTESLFLLETIIFFLALKHQRFFLAAVVAGVSSATRLAGSLLMFSLLLAIYPFIKTHKSWALLLPLSLTGLFAYMTFLAVRFGDPFAFVHVQSMFGVGRSTQEVVLLPQVIYRYLKIFESVDPATLLFARALLEFSSFCFFVTIYFRQFSSLSKSLSLYLLTSLLLPTLSGTLSSLPRYLLVLIPFLYQDFRPKPLTMLLFGCSLTLMIVLLTLFASGQFVA